MGKRAIMWKCHVLKNPYESKRVVGLIVFMHERLHPARMERSHTNVFSPPSFKSMHIASSKNQDFCHKTRIFSQMHPSLKLIKCISGQGRRTSSYQARIPKYNLKKRFVRRVLKCSPTRKLSSWGGGGGSQKRCKAKSKFQSIGAFDFGAKTRGPKGHISCTWEQCAPF